MRLTLLLLPALLLPALLLTAQSNPNQPTKEAARWWSHVEILAADNMEGRDTGSEGYRRAARYVAEQFERAGLKPAGESGCYQPVPLRDRRIDPAKSSIELLRATAATPLPLNRQIGITPRAGLPTSLEGPLLFAGYGDDLTGTDTANIKGAVLVIFPGKVVPGQPTVLASAQRLQAAALVTIDNPRALETPRWPIAYARAMSLEGGSARGSAPTTLVSMRLNPAAAADLFKNSGHSWDEILDLGAAGKPLPHFPIPARLRAKIAFEETAATSDNLIATLPGSDPALRDEYVLVSAHLDGYGRGEAVNGDPLYNGAFDDAACVANLLELAADLQRSGRKLRRTLLFAIYTGEEKGLLGSNWFVSHLTVPKDKIVANINLDYIRPIFPLTILTTLGLEDSTLGDTARAVGAPMGIRIQTDNEPERGLFRRSDQFNFIRNGIPGIAFVFGYTNGSKEEAIYRAWYRDRYHKPQDDLLQPVDFPAAVKFQQFFNALAENVADADARPRWNPASPYAPATKP